MDTGRSCDVADGETRDPSVLDPCDRSSEPRGLTALRRHVRSCRCGRQQIHDIVVIDREARLAAESALDEPEEWDGERGVVGPLPRASPRRMVDEIGEKSATAERESRGEGTLATKVVRVHDPRILHDDTERAGLRDRPAHAFLDTTTQYQCDL